MMGPKKIVAFTLSVFWCTTSLAHASLVVPITMPSPSALLALLLLPSMVPSPPSTSPNTASWFAVAASPNAATASERRRRRRREEEKKRTRSWYDDEDDAGGDGSFHVSLGGLFVTQKPRDVLEGARAALSNSLRGALYGLVALVAGPVAGLKSGDGAGVVAGLAAGLVAGVVLPVVGVVVGGFQLLRGFTETPAAIKYGFLECRLFDETARDWRTYRLDDDAADIEAALREEEERRKKAENKPEQRGRRQVKSTAYYDLLGVSPDAAPSAVRSAYRREARRVHPDKNPDDPAAAARFRELSAAYQTLSDPARRKRYDASGVGVDPTRPEGADGGPAMVDPVVFFAVLFGAEAVEPYVGELGMATAFDALLKLGAGSPGAASLDSWEDVKTAFGWSEAALKRRKREADIATHLRARAADYVDELLAADAFRDSCREEARGIAAGGSYGASFLLAIGPALVVEADAFLGYRSSVLESWRGPVSNAKRNLLHLRRKWGVARSVVRTALESVKALYNSAEVVSAKEGEARRRRRLDEHGPGGGRGRRGGPERVAFHDKELLRDNLSRTLPTVLGMAWAINHVDIANALHGACDKLFHDAGVPSWEERLRRAEAMRILGSQFYAVGLEATAATGGNATAPGGGDIDEIKARANAAFVESLRQGMDDNKKKRSASDEM